MFVTDFLPLASVWLKVCPQEPTQDFLESKHIFVPVTKPNAATMWKLSKGC